MKADETPVGPEKEAEPLGEQEANRRISTPPEDESVYPENEEAWERQKKNERWQPFQSP